MPAEARLCLVVDKSSSYLAFQKQRLIDEWEVEAKDIKLITHLQEAKGITLFGGGTVSILTITDADEAKNLAIEVENTPALLTSISSGLMVLCSADRRSTKKLETLITKAGGEVRAVKESKDKASNSEKLVSELTLNSATRDYLLSYVGDDYESLVPLVKAMSALTPAQQNAVSEEDIYIRLPQAPGAVAPWSLEKPLFAGQYDEVIDVFRRVAQHSSLLVVLAVIRNKLQLAYRVAALTELGSVRTSSKLAEVLQVPDNYPLKIAMNYAKKYGMLKLEEVNVIIAKAEAQVKGGAALDPKVVMETALIKISEALRA